MLRLAVAAIAVTCVAGSAQAAPALAGAWLPPEVIASGSLAVPAVNVLGAALGAGGDASVTWSSAGAASLELRPAGGAWSADDGVPQAQSIDVGIDGAGTAYAAYSEVVAGETRVLAATRGPSGWGAPVELSPADVAGVTAIRVAVADDGSAVAFWARQVSPTLSTLEYAHRAPNGAWAPAAAAIGGFDGTAGTWRFSHLPSGEVAVAWVDSVSGEDLVAVGSTQDGAFTAEHTARSGDISALQVAPAGVVLLAGPDQTSALAAWIRDPGTHVWGPAHELIPASDPVVEGVTTAAGPDGGIWLGAWQFDAGTGTSSLEAFGMTPGGTWLGPDLLTSTPATAPGAYHDAQMAVLHDGTVMAAFREGFALAVRARPPGGAWLPAYAAITGAGEDYVPRAFLASTAGDALLVAQTGQCDGACRGVAVRFDGSPPHLTATAPATGEAAGMSATALAPARCRGQVVPPGGAACPGPRVTGFSARAVATWRVSRVDGFVRVHARLGAGKLSGSVALLRPDGSAALTWKFSPRMNLSIAMALPSSSVPGRWSVRIRATDALGQTVTAAHTFRLRAPPEGVVRRAAVSALGRTQHAVRARFVFAAKPKHGRQVVVTWYHGKRVVWRAKKRSFRVIDSTLYTLPDGPPLPAGAWRCAIGIGKRLAKSIAFTVGA